MSPVPASNPRSDWPSPRAAEWAAALADLEHDVSTVEQVVQGLSGHTATDVQGVTTHDEGTPPLPWQPPAGLGPMPDALAARARELVARQHQAAQDLAVATALVRRQVRYADRVVDLSGHQHPRPAYLDIQA